MQDRRLQKRGVFGHVAKGQRRQHCTIRSRAALVFLYLPSALPCRAAMLQVAADCKWPAGRLWAAEVAESRPMDRLME
jgi:hypothetical protein